MCARVFKNGAMVSSCRILCVTMTRGRGESAKMALRVLLWRLDGYWHFLAAVLHESSPVQAPLQHGWFLAPHGMQLPELQMKPGMQ